MLADVRESLEFADCTYVKSCSVQNVSKEVRDGVRVCERAFVLRTVVSFGSRYYALPVVLTYPVVGNLLLTLVGHV